MKINNIDELKNNVNKLNTNEILRYSLKFDCVETFSMLIYSDNNSLLYSNEELIKKSIRYDAFECFKYIIRHYIFINNFFSKNAIKDLKYVKYIVEELNIDIHYNNEEAFRNASHFGFYDVVKYLTEKGVNIHSLSEFALKISTINGYFKQIKLLCKNGADLVTNMNYVICYSCKHNHLNILKYILNYLNEYKQSIYDYETKMYYEITLFDSLKIGIMYAIQYNHKTIMNFLQKKYNLIDNDCINKSVKYSDLNTFKYILKQVHNELINNDELFKNAIFNKRYDIINFLIYNGYNYMILNNFYQDENICNIIKKFERYKKLSNIIQ